MSIVHAYSYRADRRRGAARGTYKKVAPAKTGGEGARVLQDEREVGQCPRKLWGEQAIEDVQSLAQLQLERQARNGVLAQSLGSKASCVGGDAAKHDNADRTA